MCTVSAMHMFYIDLSVMWNPWSFNNVTCNFIRIWSELFSRFTRVRTRHFVFNYSDSSKRRPLGQSIVEVKSMVLFIPTSNVIIIDMKKLTGMERDNHIIFQDAIDGCCFLCNLRTNFKHAKFGRRILKDIAQFGHNYLYNSLRSRLMFYTS
jgi:hypothetical protein